MVHRPHKRVILIAFALVSILVLVLVVPTIFQNKASEKPIHNVGSRVTSTSTPIYEVLKEDIGIGSILLNKSTKEDIIQIYGNEYREIYHASVSTEMVYDQLGITFFFSLGSPVVWLINVRPPFQGVTTQGIVLGESTLEDVFAIYGSTEDWYCNYTMDNCWVEYPGVQFHIQYKVLPTPLWVSNDNYLSEKIIEITIGDLNS